MSYSNYKSGPSRGRGFSSRGSHRGSSAVIGGWGGGSGGNSRGRGGGYSPPRSSRGRGGWHREVQISSSYEHGRSSSSGGRYFDVSDDRFAPRSREDTFRRYRQDSPGYTGPDVSSHHRSPESSRKRMRTDHGYHQASSHHRSHESSSFDFNSRYGDTSSYGNEEKGYDRYREERRNYRDYHSGERYSPRDDYMHHRKDLKDSMDRHDLGRSSMPPPLPPSINPRHSASPRRSSFRGRGGLERIRGSRSRPSSLRGSSRGSRSSLAIRKAEVIASMKRRSLADASYIIKKRILNARASQEQLKKLRMQKIRRIKENIESVEGESTSVEVKKEDWNEDQDVKDTEDIVAIKMEKNEEKEEPEEEIKNDDESKLEEIEIKKESDTSMQVTIKQNAEGRAVNEENVRKSPIPLKRFIRLQCPHCHERCVTFKQYTAHLYGSKHLIAMRRLILRQKQSVLRLRQQQRKIQREEEEREAESLSKFSSFCSVCKLNYRQEPSTHTRSKMHQEMKKLLYPYCKVCGISFKATLLYDKHICSLDHIRREAYLEERIKQLDGRTHSSHDLDGEDKDMDMDGFMIVDSVGDVDDTEEIDGEKNEEKLAVDSLVGLEFIKSVEALYCNLCQRYLPRLDDTERAQGVHCRSSQHLRLFRDHQRISRTQSKTVEEKNDVDNQPVADVNPQIEKPTDTEEVVEDEAKDKESVLEQESTNTPDTDTNANDGVSKEAETEATEVAAEEEEEDHEGEIAEEKLWADVDKDLGELLRDVGPEEEEEDEEEEEEEDHGVKSSEDDDESVAESGRYDRFRYSEKLESDKEMQSEPTDKKNGNEEESVDGEK